MLIRFLLLAEEDEVLELRAGDLHLLLDQVIDLAIEHPGIFRVRDVEIQLGDQVIPDLATDGQEHYEVNAILLV